MTNSWDKLIHIIEKSDYQTIKAFFELFLTPTEKQAIADRLQLVQLLLDNKLSQRDMAKQYNISIAKITRGSNMLKNLSEDKRRWLSDLLTD